MPAKASPTGIRSDRGCRRGQEDWRDYKLEATRDLAAKVARIAHEHKVPAGGWVSAGMEAAQLAEAFDFLGGMIYTEPPRTARLMHWTLGQRPFHTLLWGAGEAPARMEQEVREAVHAGSATVGFWVYPPGHTGTGQFRMRDGNFEAIARAFAGAEEEWDRFHRDNLLRGDPRYVTLDVKVAKQEMTLRVRNTGRKPRRE